MLNGIRTLEEQRVVIVPGNARFLNSHLNKIISIRITQIRHLAVLSYDQFLLTRRVALKTSNTTDCHSTGINF